jgi:predicted molibdopterin-dependent oxidoreductase YjgC
LDLEGILRGIEDGSIKALYVLEDDIASDPRFSAAIKNLQVLIVHSAVRNRTTEEADVVLSCSTYAEKNGTFTNFQGRVQRIRAAVATQEQDRARDGFAMSRWDKFASQNDRWGRPVKKDARPTWRILMNVGNALGAKLRYASAEDVFKEMAERIGGMKGMTYLRVGSLGQKVVPTDQPTPQAVSV